MIGSSLASLALCLVVGVASADILEERVKALRLQPEGINVSGEPDVASAVALRAQMQALGAKEQEITAALTQLGAKQAEQRADVLASPDVPAAIAFRAKLRLLGASDKEILRSLALLGTAGEASATASVDAAIKLLSGTDSVAKSAEYKFTDWSKWKPAMPPGLLGNQLISMPI